MYVLVASQNPVKIDATRDAFAAAFDDRAVVEGLAVASGVPDQPLGGQTWEGARRRARALAGRPEAADARFCVGIEGGIERTAGRWFGFGAMCVRHADGREGLGGSPRFELPGAIMRGVAAGRELGEVMDELLRQTGTKQRGGAVEHLTAGVMDRRELYRAGVVTALAPFLRADLYASEQPAPALEGIVETALYVADLERATSFYRGLFGCPVLFEDDRLCALAVGTDQVLLLFRRGASLEPTRLEGGTIPPHDGAGRLHVAFGADGREIEAWSRRIMDAGVELESRVEWPRGGVSLYFRDPDGNAIELVTRGCWSIY